MTYFNIISGRSHTIYVDIVGGGFVNAEWKRGVKAKNIFMWYVNGP